MRRGDRIKVAIGLVLGLAIGALCRLVDIPSPAPSALSGALLVVAMTFGYIAADHRLARNHALHQPNCGGPDGMMKSTGQGLTPDERKQRPDPGSDGASEERHSRRDQA